MRMRIAALSALVVLAYGCASTRPVPPTPDHLHGIASWYGEEFAGRTTANGEIFDPALLTAAHRTLPFGTILDVTNPNTKQTVRVRVNDRGPYIGNRMIDLSWAAAKQIGLVEPGVGEVDINVVKVGSGEREPPAPMDVTIAESPRTAPVVTAGDPPPIAFPLPSSGGDASSTPVVERVDVQTQRGGVITRRQVAADGTQIEEVPIAVVPPAAPPAATATTPAATAPAATAQSSSPAKPVKPQPRPARVAARQYLVQAGAFSVEANAKLLQERLTAIGQPAFVDQDDLYRVRIGPFATREQALEVREALESRGMSAMIVVE